MSSVPAGKRSWKCPECGSEILLSVAQLDPIACDACVAKMRGGGAASGVPSVTDAVAGPLGMWAALPEMTKLGIAVGALVIGLLIGYAGGKASVTSSPATTHRAATHPKATEATVNDSSDEPTSAEVSNKRPDPPGPGYKWVRGRKQKDGSYGPDHWIKDSHYDPKKSADK